MKPSKPSIVWLTKDWDANEYRTANDLYGGIGYYRVIKPSQVLREHFDIEVVGADIQHWGTTAETYHRIGQYDLIISKHLRTAEEASNLLATADHFKKKVLVDIDDNYLNVRKDNPAFKEYEYGNGPSEYVSAMISLSNGTIVSTAPLKKAYSSLSKHIDVLPNCNDINDWPNVRKMWDDGTIRIGFSGGQGHLADLELILEPMAYLLAKYPNVVFEICSAVWPKEAMDMVNKMNDYCKKDISKQVRLGGGTEGGVWRGYPELLTSFGWDIVIAPLVDDEFNRGKSHIRWMEASMIHCPVVASPVYPYQKTIQGVKTIENEKTGFFANSSEEWYSQLEKLVKDKDLRRQVSDKAYEYIKDNWQYSQWMPKWKKVIEKYI